MRFAWLLLIPLGILTFYNLKDAGFVGDDYDQVAANLSIRSLNDPMSFLTGSTFYSGGGTELRGTYYKPVMTAAFALVYNLVGTTPFHFHVVQVVLGILNAILLYFFFRSLFSWWVALSGAALFLVHPTNSEVIQYISNYQDVLFMTFGLAALNVEAYRRSSHWGWFALEGLLLLLAGLSKETGLLFIPILAVCSVMLRKSRSATLGGLQWRKDLASLRIFLVVGLTIGAYAALRIFVSNISEIHSHYAPMETALLTTRLINVPAVVFYYIQNFF